MFASIRRGFTSFAQSNQVWSWTLFRVLTAAMFMTHGFDKLLGGNPQAPTGSGMTRINIEDTIVFNMPMDINALFVAGVIEFVGGLCILLGFWTRLFALIAALSMLMAYLTTHFAWFPTLNNGELAALYFFAFLILFTNGGGPLSADNLFAMRRQKKNQTKIDAAFKD